LLGSVSIEKAFRDGNIPGKQTYARGETEFQGFDAGLFVAIVIVEIDPMLAQVGKEPEICTPKVAKVL